MDAKIRVIVKQYFSTFSDRDLRSRVFTNESKSSITPQNKASSLCRSSRSCDALACQLFANGALVGYFLLSLRALAHAPLIITTTRSDVSLMVVFDVQKVTWHLMLLAFWTLWSVAQMHNQFHHITRKSNICFMWTHATKTPLKIQLTELSHISLTFTHDNYFFFSSRVIYIITTQIQFPLDRNRFVETNKITLIILNISDSFRLQESVNGNLPWCRGLKYCQWQLSTNSIISY